MGVSINRRTAAIVERMVVDPLVLRIEVMRLDNGAQVIDCGVKVEGGFGAGKAVVEICLGGLGEAGFSLMELDDLVLPVVTVVVDFPVIGCMASQYAGWKIEVGKFFAMGSGPARALSRVEELFEKLDYRDEADVAVLVLETSTLPLEEVAEYVAKKCGILPSRLTLVAAATRSIAGSIQIAARSVETAMHKLDVLGFDLKKVVSGFGACPLAPASHDDLKAIGRTNDCVLYGSEAYLTVLAKDEEIEAIIEEVPSSASKDYGIPSYDLFKRYGDFYKIDPLLFSPAKITIANARSGRIFRAGKVNKDLLRSALLS